MSYVYLILSVFTLASASIFGTYYNRANEGKRDITPLYNFMQLAVITTIWFALYLFDFSFDVGVLPYAILFAAFYTVNNIGVLGALFNGPTSLTSLFVTLSLLLTTIWGFFFWGASPTFIVITGLVLVVISMTLCLYTGKKEEKKITFKWLVYIAMAFFGNAACMIVQKEQQLAFDGAHGKMLMAFATFFAMLAFLVIYLRSDKRDSRVILKASWGFPVFAGAANVVLNMSLIALALSELSPSLIYPVSGVGELVVVMFFSVLAFKEHLNRSQWVGVVVGAVATVLLSV